MPEPVPPDLDASRWVKVELLGHRTLYGRLFLAEEESARALQVASPFDLTQACLSKDPMQLVVPAFDVDGRWQRRNVGDDSELVWMPGFRVPSQRFAFTWNAVYCIRVVTEDYVRQTLQNDVGFGSSSWPLGFERPEPVVVQEEVPQELQTDISTAALAADRPGLAGKVARVVHVDPSWVLAQTRTNGWAVFGRGGKPVVDDAHVDVATYIDDIGWLPQEVRDAARAPYRPAEVPRG